MKCIHALAQWVAYLTLQGKMYFKSDIMSGAIEESRLYFEDTRDGKQGLSNPEQFSHENWTQWEDIIYS